MKLEQLKEQMAGVVGHLEAASSQVVELSIKRVVFSDKDAPVVDYTFVPKYPLKRVKVKLTDVE